MGTGSIDSVATQRYIKQQMFSYVGPKIEIPTTEATIRMSRDNPKSHITCEDYLAIAIDPSNPKGICFIATITLLYTRLQEA